MIKHLCFNGKYYFSNKYSSWLKCIYLLFFFFIVPIYKTEKRKIGWRSISLTKLFVGLVNSIILYRMILFPFEMGIYQMEKMRFLGSHCQQTFFHCV